LHIALTSKYRNIEFVFAPDDDTAKGKTFV
jgi:hypothetical protein